jgi:LPS export ABC transporter permease LptG/LPS export ABC transporter permease LptF
MRVRRLDRYLVREIVGPLALGFLVYTFILLIRFLFQSAEMIIRRGLPLSVVGELLVYTLPNIVVLTIPMSLLFGILIAVGRLASDSELIALRSSGVSLVSLYRPILFISAVFWILNTALMVWVLPWGNHSLQYLRLTIITETVARQVEPRVFYSEFEGALLYVFEQPESVDQWRGVMLAQSMPGTRNQVTVADAGRLTLDEAGERVVLELEKAVTHEIDFNQAGSYQINRQDRVGQVLQDEFTSSQRRSISASKTVREQSIEELLNLKQDREVSDEMRNLARVEIHKKFSIPFACMVFGLCALPLGFNNRRGSKASGFALSILVILVYYVMLSNGEEAARFGRLPPWAAMWIPNLVMAVIGVALLFRRNRDKSLLLSKVDRWVREDLWSGIRVLQGRRKERRRERKQRREERRSQRPGGGPDLVLRLPRLRLVFPNLIDRYVIRVFSFVFFMVLLSALSIYVIADFSEMVDEVIKNDVARSVVFDYYKYLVLQIFYDLAPILVLVSTLITFSLLSRSNEVTAWKALGVSLYRLAVPALFTALGVALLCALLQTLVLPASNARVAQLEDRIRGRETPRTFRRADRQWLFGQERYVYNYLHYDAARQTLQRLQVFEFDDSHRLIGRLFASSATYDPESGRWLVEDGWIRRFEGVEIRSYQLFESPRLIDFPETPDYFQSEVRAPEQMNYGNLKDYIQEVEASGQRVPELRVQLYNKLAYPVVAMVMAFVALPFAFRLGRQGALYGIGLSIVLGMVFYVVYAFFTTLGEAAALPPVVAVWSPGVLFTLFATWLFLGVRT